MTALLTARGQARRGARRRAVLALALAAASIALMLLVCARTDPNRVVTGDGYYVFAAARSLAYDGDLDLTNQYVVMGDHWGLGRDPASDGWRLPAREIGASLVMVPGLWVHDLLHLSPRWEPAFACLLAAGSLGLCWLGCARSLLALGLDARASEGLAAGAVLGFVVPYYAWVTPGYNHAPDAAIGAWLCWALVERRPPATIGLLLACAVSVRMQNLLFVLWPLSLALSSDARGRRDRGGGLGELARIIGLAALGFLPQIWLGLAHPGSTRGALGWTGAFFDLDDYGRDLVRVLVGTHGLIRSTPVAGLGLLGLAWAAAPSAARPEPERARERASEVTAAREAAIARAALLVFAALWLLFASVRDVNGGTAFGARRFAGFVGPLALGLGLLWRRAQHGLGSRGALALAAAISLASATNLWLCYEAAAGLRSLASPSPPGARPSSGQNASPSQR